ncbi:MAG: glycosyltransferase family 4 protein [Bryobacterales bacterium]|nr:glycosyltransferase family 4 protein [Bryobacterales bacterium]
MKVALDATPLVEPAGGIRRYTVELAQALARNYPEDEVRLVSDQAYQPLRDAGIRQERVSAGRWWSLGLPRWLRQERIDLFHGTDFAVPYLPVRPAVMTVHDLSPWRFREGSERVRRRVPWLLRFGLATMIITPSEAIRRELLATFPVSPEEVRAVPLAAASHLKPTLPTAGQQPYFLYVGALEPRKNLETLVEAWSGLEGIDLILAGRPRPGFSVAARPGLRILGEVAEHELASWYSGALAAVYPSQYEGFGIPVLEAMQCGAPVITSLDPAIRETAGDAALSVADAGLRHALRRVASDPALRAELRANGLRRAAQFSWDRTAQLTHDVYRTALRRYSG